MSVSPATYAGTAYLFETAVVTDSYALTVTKSGSGFGTVAGSGISCGNDCSETYLAGTSVTLAATPAVGSTFVGWSGACTNSSGNCAVTMGSCAKCRRHFQC